ncbi:hypothetical protein BDY17DRAFT_312998 [Neohortaea acidophila]|uniref:DUF7918 domain-containing protein n=1 Tax=Neohortaea acidophila TaxID=245834 RepID=A0A6A6PKU4_9PEZI|nr:uncharacterized protein BDY17DRAFT_312998 [Neohortaea acidophila]KAF2480113.1 hypothetical protein BDY17DRAFT_312998 [Neohortaea acidophila]
MAILDTVPGLVVTIDVAGLDLPEYADTDQEDPHPNANSAYVVAESGAQFGIATRFDAAQFPYQGGDVEMQLSLDGKPIGLWTQRWSRDIQTGTRRVVSTLTSKRQGYDVVESFSFAELHISEGEADMKLWGKLGELGTVCVDFWRIREEVSNIPTPAQPLPTPRSTGRKHRGRGNKQQKSSGNQNANMNPPDVSTPLLAEDEVPEKNFKGRAISHQAKLSITKATLRQSRSSNSAPKVQRYWVRLDTNPFASFVFKYRSRQALQQLHIVPRTPTPVPLEERPIEELTSDEMRELLKRQRETDARKASMARIKKEKRERQSDGEEEDDEGEIEISEVRASKAAKREGPGPNIEIVDLSDRRLAGSSPATTILIISNVALTSHLTKRLFCRRQGCEFRKTSFPNLSMQPRRATLPLGVNFGAALQHNQLEHKHDLEMLTAMANPPTLDAIDPEAFNSLLEQYPNIVPDKLHALDEQRYDTIPQAIRDRDGPSCLTKEELVTLVEWKLSHGKFRPALKGLAQQNTEESVANTTKEGYEAFTGSTDSVKPSLNALTKLRGIGPATASLLLSVFDPSVAPFFSDELFRWSFFESGKGKGWDREIKYNMKEYLQLFDRVQDLQGRLQKHGRHETSAVEIEKVAYVLGKQALHGVGDKTPQETTQGT